MYKPLFPKRKADTIANGFFLVCLGILFYTDQWWPGLLFAIGLNFALRQYLTGRRFNFLVTVSLLGFLGLITLIGLVSSLLIPLVFVSVGLYLIAKECFPHKNREWMYPFDHSRRFKE